MLQLCTQDAPTLFQSTQADNMLHLEDLETLAFRWDTVKLKHIGDGLKSTGWTAAMDLALWCLQAVSARRPWSFEAVFKHQLFDSTGELHFMRSGEHWDDFVRRQAAELHTAIDQEDMQAVHKLFSLGAVHLGTIDPTVQSYAIPPLLHAIFKGNVDVVRRILKEISSSWPVRVRSQFLDCRTALDYTPYLLSCKCGYVEVAGALQEHGCDINLVNSSGFTGAELLAEFEHEVELANVQPWYRGDQLHLAATAPAEFISSVDAELNEHVRAGMRVWNSKQIVSHCNRKQLEALQAQLTQLVMHTLVHASYLHSHTTCKKVTRGREIALHFTDLRSSRPILHGTGLKAFSAGQLGGRI